MIKLNKNIWMLLLLVGGIGLFTLISEFNILSVSNSLNILNYSSSGGDELSIGGAIFMELFCSVHMSFFVLIPLSKIFAKEKYTYLFIVLFVIRAIVLLVGNFISTYIAVVDFIAVFIGAFIIVPICAFITKTNLNSVIGHRNNDDSLISFEDFGANFEMLDAGIDFAKTEIGDINVLIKSLILEYTGVNKAFFEGDYKKLKDLCSSDVYIDYKVKRDLYESVNEKNILEDVDFYDVKLTRFKKCGKEIIAELTIKYTCLEYVIDKNNRVVRGSNTEYKDIMKKVSFSKKLSSEIIFKCDNCGANVSGDECDYCGSTINYKVGDWVFLVKN